jgi:hypothetical protein
MRRSALTSAFLAALFAATGLAGCMQASTYGTGEVPELAIFREATGGLGKQKKKPIQYQPRAPLVMPPSGEAAALPAPVETASAADSAWPEDPDQIERKRTYGDDTPLDDVTPEYARRLKPLAALDDGKPVPQYSGADHNPNYDVIDSKTQRATVKAAMKDAKGIHAERRYLTDPPDAYKVPAATAPSEFKEIDDATSGNFLTRMFTGLF